MTNKWNDWLAQFRRYSPPFSLLSLSFLSLWSWTSFFSASSSFLLSLSPILFHFGGLDPSSFFAKYRYLSRLLHFQLFLIPLSSQWLCLIFMLSLMLFSLSMSLCVISTLHQYVRIRGSRTCFSCFSHSSSHYSPFSSEPIPFFLLFLFLSSSLLLIFFFSRSMPLSSLHNTYAFLVDSLLCVQPQHRHRGL